MAATAGRIIAAATALIDCAADVATNDGRKRITRDAAITANIKLPLLGQALVARGASDPSVFTSATIIIAQLTMIATALFAARLAEQRGYWLVFLIVQPSQANP
jgi:hypothetical protein